MRPIRPPFATRRERSPRRSSLPALTAVTLAAALAFTTTACGSSENGAAGSVPSVSVDPGQDGGDSGGSGGIEIPEDLKDRLKEHGIDVDKWRGGEWKNWDKDDWLREAEDYINPIIEDLWDPDRMREAEQPEKPVAEDIAAGQGVTDAEPAPVEARPVEAPYAENAPQAGKVFFDGPNGSMVCSATVVQDPANPGKSNLVWTAGHCVHAGAKGGWYRNIAFVPSYNNDALPTAELGGATQEDVAPFGVWWGDWAQTSDQWIAQGGPTGGAGASYDFAVIHVTPESGGGKSLEETVGSALPVNFEAPEASGVENVTAIGYPAAPPFDGESMQQCSSGPSRLSLGAKEPTMYRIGCTMTGGSSGGGWIGDIGNGPELLSNTSIGPVNGGWLAGPRLGAEAEGVYQAVSRKFAG
ncbi:trypsin-like serine peptidase [Streptomyces sp. NPDC060194]|uniref:trypsin-like serine peptidase n=1 Tax=Streptomyces sp. NPDC060194 TaxID=3347069 RepID=UPI0036493A4D